MYVCSTIIALCNSDLVELLKLSRVISAQNRVAAFGGVGSYLLTVGEQKLYLDGKDAELMKGKKILIVDDVASTGASLLAVEQLVEKAGGIICGKMAILAEGAAIARGDIIYLEPLPLFNADGSVKE